jgi:hypothetical protein
MVVVLVDVLSQQGNVRPPGLGSDQRDREKQDECTGETNQRFRRMDAVYLGSMGCCCGSILLFAEVILQNPFA